MNVYYDVEDNHYRTYPDGDIATVDQMRELIENKNVSIVKLQQENKILKENAENNDKVVDKVNWGNQLLKKEIHQLKEQLEASEKARKESMLILGEYRHYTMPTEEQNRENEDIVDKAYNNLILKQDIDKGE